MDLGLRMRSSLWMYDVIILLMGFMRFKSHLLHQIILLRLIIGSFCMLFIWLQFLVACKIFKFFPTFIIAFSFLVLDVVSFLVLKLIFYIFISLFTSHALCLIFVFFVLLYMTSYFSSLFPKIFRFSLWRFLQNFWVHSFKLMLVNPQNHKVDSVI
jgi:hypothetical protein